MNQESNSTSSKLRKTKEQKPARRTVGQEAIDVFKNGTVERNPVELQREMTRGYYQNLVDCALNNRRKYPGTFFIVVITKNEKLMPNVFRNYFFARQSCPSPDYDQSVFRYDYRNEEIHYIWTIPSQDACIHLLNHADEVVKEERQLLQFVKDFKSGALYRLAKKFSREKEKAPNLEHREYIS